MLTNLNVDLASTVEWTQEVEQRNREEFAALETPVHGYGAMDDFDVDPEFLPELPPEVRRCGCVFHEHPCGKNDTSASIFPRPTVWTPISCRAATQTT